MLESAHSGYHQYGEDISAKNFRFFLLGKFVTIGGLRSRATGADLKIQLASAIGIVFFRP